MAPQTTQEVLSNGDYLEKNFDPNSLRKDVLLGILVHHGVPYPSQHKKDTLVTLFNEEIKPRAAELKHALQRAKRQEASSEGVIDGVTGRNVAGVAVSPLHLATLFVDTNNPNSLDEEPLLQLALLLKR